MDRSEIPTLNFTNVCTKVGQYVIFYNERISGVDYPKEYETNAVFIELCEVIVQGTGKQYYIPNILKTIY